MTNLEKQNLAEILRDHADMIVEQIGCKNGYQNDIEHLDPKEVREQLNKWLDKLPFAKLEADAALQKEVRVVA
jgi:hypothetical protein